ncbi:MAG: TonB-dependent receptor plug domain-containing protein, partial [Sphingopyxis granuli]
MIRLLAGVAALALPVTALAEETGDQDIVVTGAGLLRPAPGDGAQGVAVLRDLDPGLGSRIENRLRDEAGIVQFRRSDGRTAHPTSQGVTLRGLGGNASSRALVTLDGVPQADPFGAWVAWSAYDAIRLGGIVVARGGGSGAD